MIETLKFDVAQLRRVEWTREALDGDTRILHSSYRLITWELLPASQVPASIFDFGRR